MSDLPERMLGKYQLIAELARGGMGIVYLAMVQGPGGFNKLLVVKELKPELVEEPAFLTMFLDEARLAARLNHPNIVQTNEVGNDGDRYFMAMDYLDGRGLDQVRRRSRALNNSLSVPMYLRILCGVLEGLEYAHKLADFDGTPLHIVHRDVSPQNVFVTFEGQVKLLDFGIAKARDSMHETNAGVLKGKVSYMAPEQARGQKVDERADVFSAGMMLWEALTGRRMREGQNEQQMLWALASGDLPRASTVKPYIAPELDEICARAMAFDREQRYPSAGALREDIEGYMERSGTSASAREVGACVSELFREDRATINALIESHVARARGGASRGDLPIIHVSSRLGSPTPSSARSHRPPDSTMPPFRDGLGIEPTVPESRRASAGLASMPGPPSITGAPSLSLTPSMQSLPSMSGAGMPGLADPGAPRAATSTRAMRFAIPAVAAVAVLLMVVIVTRSNDTPAASVRHDDRRSAAAEPPAPSAPVARAEGPSPAPAPNRPNLIDVAVSVVPSGASIMIDGAEVSGNPLQAKYAADGAMHNIRATAPGYVAKTKAVAFDGDVTLEIKLEKVFVPLPPPPPPRIVAAPPRPPVRTVRPADPPDPPPAVERPEPPKPASTDVAPAGGTKPRRPIDTTYPGDTAAPAGGTKPRRPIDSSNPYGDP